MRVPAHPPRTRRRGAAGRGRRGVAAIELALTLPILLALAVVSLEWGMYFHRQLQLSSAVRDAGLAAGGDTWGLDAERVAVDRVTESLRRSGFELDGATTTAETQPDPMGDGSVVVLTVSVPWQSVSRLVPMPHSMTARSAYALINQ
jgi:uncharacterized membrane protein